MNGTSQYGYIRTPTKKKGRGQKQKYVIQQNLIH